MGIYFVGIREGDIENGSLTLESQKQLEETTKELKGSTMYRSIVYPLYRKELFSGNSVGQQKTAEKMVQLLGENYKIITVEVLGQVKKKLSAITTLDKKLSELWNEYDLPPSERYWGESCKWGYRREVVGIGRGELLWGYLNKFEFDKIKEFTNMESLKPGECYILRLHYGLSPYQELILPSRGLCLDTDFECKYTGTPPNHVEQLNKK